MIPMLKSRGFNQETFLGGAARLVKMIFSSPCLNGGIVSLSSEVEFTYSPANSCHS